MFVVYFLFLVAFGTASFGVLNSGFLYLMPKSVCLKKSPWSVFWLSFLQILAIALVFTIFNLAHQAFGVILLSDSALWDGGFVLVAAFIGMVSVASHFGFKYFYTVDFNRLAAWSPIRKVFFAYALAVIIMSVLLFVFRGHLPSGSGYKFALAGDKWLSSSEAVLMFLPLGIPFILSLFVKSPAFYFSFFMLCTFSLLVQVLSIFMPYT